MSSLTEQVKTMATLMPPTSRVSYWVIARESCADDEPGSWSTDDVRKATKMDNKGPHTLKGT